MDTTKNHIKKDTYLCKVITLDDYALREQYPIIPPNFLFHSSYLLSKINYCNHVSYSIGQEAHCRHTAYAQELIPEDNPIEFGGMTVKNQMVDIKETLTIEII